MIAWVLVVGLIGQNTPFAVSGIESEAECKRLGAAMYADAFAAWPKIKCYPYYIAK